MPSTVSGLATRDNPKRSSPNLIHGRRISIKQKKTIFGEVFEENPPKKSVPFKPLEEDGFHPAADTIRCSARKLVR